MPNADSAISRHARSELTRPAFKFRSSPGPLSGSFTITGDHTPNTWTMADAPRARARARQPDRPSLDRRARRGRGDDRSGGEYSPCRGYRLRLRQGSTWLGHGRLSVGQVVLLGLHSASIQRLALGV